MTREEKKTLMEEFEIWAREDGLDCTKVGHKQYGTYADGYVDYAFKGFVAGRTWRGNNAITPLG